MTSLNNDIDSSKIYFIPSFDIKMLLSSWARFVDHSIDNAEINKWYYSIECAKTVKDYLNSTTDVIIPSIEIVKSKRELRIELLMDFITFIYNVDVSSNEIYLIITDVCNDNIIKWEYLHSGYINIFHNNEKFTLKNASKNDFMDIVKDKLLMDVIYLQGVKNT